jgi:hypothetical protein
VNVTFSDVGGISTVWINDTTNFNITDSGFIDDKITLGANAYYVNVSVNDSFNNIASGIFLLNVTKASPSVAQYIGGFRSNVLADVNENGYTDLITTNCTTNGDTYSSIQNSTNYSVGLYTFTCTYIASQNYSQSFEEWTMTVGAYNDSTNPTFTVVPNDAVILPNETWSGVQFTCTDNIGISGYTVNDTNFVINSSGYLSDLFATGNNTLLITCTDLNNNYATEIYNIYFISAPYINNQSVTTYGDWQGIQMSGNVPLTNWSVDNAIFQINASGYIVYIGNLTNGSISTGVNAQDSNGINATGTMTLTIRENVGLNFGACPTSSNYWYLYLVLAIAMIFIFFAEKVRVRLFGIFSGLILIFLALYTYGCSLMFGLIFLFGGIILIWYYATAK